MMKEECVFCKIAKGELKADKIKESNNFFAIRDINPKSKGHTLIIPKKHFVTLLDMNNNLGEELIKFMKDAASELLEQKYGEGFNVIMNNLECAGQIVKHAHFHIIPRKEGDGLRMIS